MINLKKLFCRHHSMNQVICWHWFHGFNGNDPAFIEIQLRCMKCDRLYFRYIHDREECNLFAKCHSDKQWSEECHPILNIRYKEKTNEN